MVFNIETEQNFVNFRSFLMILLFALLPSFSFMFFDAVAYDLGGLIGLGLIKAGYRTFNVILP
jgi:hypothetical protein